MAIYFLTCANNREADKISKTLLEKRLIACSKRFPVNSSFWWKNHIDNTKEVVVILESLEENFEKIEKEIKRTSSYEVPMFFSIKASKTTQEIKKWLKEEIVG